MGINCLVALEREAWRIEIIDPGPALLAGRLPLPPRCPKRGGSQRPTDSPKAGPVGERKIRCERQDDTIPSDSERKIAKGCPANYCRLAVLDWVQSKAADTIFQPTDAEELVAAACDHLSHTIPEVITTNSKYA